MSNNKVFLFILFKILKNRFNCHFRGLATAKWMKKKLSRENCLDLIKVKASKSHMYRNILLHLTSCDVTKGTLAGSGSEPCPWSCQVLELVAGPAFPNVVPKQENVNIGLSVLHCFANNPQLLHWVKNMDVKTVKDGIFKRSVTSSTANSTEKWVKQASSKCCSSVCFDSTWCLVRANAKFQRH